MPKIDYAWFGGAVTERGRIGRAIRYSEAMTVSSPASSGPAGARFEGQVGGYYLLTMLIGAEPCGLPGTRIECVEFQRAPEGHPLDDIVVRAHGGDGSPAVLEIQAKRSLRFTKSDQGYRDVVAQIVQASQQPDFFDRRHELAVAVGRAPLNVQGPFRDVLTWARQVGSADTFMARIERPHSANDDMRRFIDAFKTHLTDAGSANDAKTVWRLLSRFQVLHFDFTGQGSAHEAWQLERAAHALQPDDAGRAEALWRYLVQLAIEAATSGGQFNRDELVQRVRDGGFSLAGERRYSSARSAIAEDARHALEDISDRVGTVRLMRGEHLAAIRTALEQGRYVEIRGEPGVGKSGLLKRLAAECSTQSRIVVLSPGRVRAGGWGAMRSAIRFQDTAHALLVDLASSGGAALFVDGLDSFSENERLTVADLVREAGEIPGFSIIATTRRGFGGEDDEPEWLPADTLDGLGRVSVVIGEFSEDEVSELRHAAPELTALLADAHPARAVVRNLFRLERLARRRAGETAVRTEIDMAADWWRTADGKVEGSRERARLLRTLAQQALATEPLNAEAHLEAAVDALVMSGTLRDLGRDRMAFRHDILRDWAIANLLCEDIDLAAILPLDRPAPASLARGFELAARMKLERSEDDAGWRRLLTDVSRDGVHRSWRRNVLLAVVRSEIGEEMLTRAAASLLADDARLLIELIRAVKAVEVRPVSAHLADSGIAVPEAAAGLHIPSGPSWTRLVLWLLALDDDLPKAVTEDVAEFFTASCVGVFDHRELSGFLAHWFYRRLEGIDAHRSDLLACGLRTGFLVVCRGAPTLAASYLCSLMQCNVHDAAIGSVWKFSSYVAQAAPEELAELTVAVLIPQREERIARHRSGFPPSLSDLPSEGWDDLRREPFDSNDIGFAPPTPERGPFLALLQHAPTVGLKLIRRLVDHAISVRCPDRPDSGDAMTVEFSDGARNFSLTETYAWSRVLGNGDPCVQSALMALEAWAHRRIDEGEDFETVLADVLPATSGPAAYLLVAVDLILSHWPNSARAAIPFVACPELLCLDLRRAIADQVPLPDVLGLDAFLKETVDLSGSDNLKARPSRRFSLDSLLGLYAVSGPSQLRVELAGLIQRAAERLGPYGDQADRQDPEFMAVRALNELDPANWRKTSTIDSRGESVGAWEYVCPPEEMEHLERLKLAAAPTMADRDMQLRLPAAVEEKSHSSSKFASQAMEWVLRLAPATVGDGGEETERRNLARTAAAVVAMRDGDEDLRMRHREWAWGVFLEALTAETGSRFVPGLNVRFNPVAMAFVGIVCLLREGVEPADIRTLLEAVSRRDSLAASGFRSAAEMIETVDGRMLRAMLRTAFVSCIRQRRAHFEDNPRADIERRVRLAIDRECSWLSGDGDEPDWPAFPMVSPARAAGLQVTLFALELTEEISRPAARPELEDILDDGSAARWLKSSSSLFDVEARPWLRDLARSYAEWTAVANGRNLNRHDKIRRRPSEWNVAYYDLVARCLPGLAVESIDQLALDHIRSLPDESFFDATGHFLRSVDQVYFGNGNLAEREAVHIRESLAERLSESAEWRLRSSDPSGSIEVHMGSTISALFFNNWDRIQSSSCYLLPPGIARIEPFLPDLERLVIEGPGGFVAGLVLDLVEVSPQPEHLSFVAAAGEAWLKVHPDKTTFWMGNEIARRYCAVIERIGTRDPYSSWDSSLRDRIGNILSALVGLGVPQAGQLEQDLAGSDE